MERRERTRHLIELGGLVQKSGLVELTQDDRATIYGALINIVRNITNSDTEASLALCRRLGKRRFDQEAEAAKKAAIAPKEVPF